MIRNHNGNYALGRYTFNCDTNSVLKRQAEGEKKLISASTLETLIYLAILKISIIEIE